MRAVDTCLLPSVLSEGIRVVESTPPSLLIWKRIRDLAIQRLSVPPVCQLSRDRRRTDPTQ